MAGDEREQAGIMVAGMGLFFVGFGVCMYLDRALLACGNLMFLTGVAIAIGARKALSFFFQKGHTKGSLFLLSGITLVLLQWAIIGLFLETIGFLLLFRHLLPVFATLAGKLPFISTLLRVFQATRLLSSSSLL
jgi:hypothetical protein